MIYLEIFSWGFFPQKVLLSFRTPYPEADLRICTPRCREKKSQRPKRVRIVLGGSCGGPNHCCLRHGLPWSRGHDWQVPR